MERIHSTLTSLFTDIANAIRNKTGSNEVLVADAFPSAITAIPTGGGGDTDAEDGIIQKTISGSYTNARVSEIGSYVFYRCSSLTTVSFPMCARIGSSAFYYCTSLTTASFPMCTSIGGSAFYSCNSLTTVSFPVCTSIEVAAFQLCSSLTTVSFPMCTSIGSSAFQGCTSLTTVSFPVCESIGGNAFYRCSSLTTVSFPMCARIENSAFRSCTRLASVYLLVSSVPYLGDSSVFKDTPIQYSSYIGAFGSIIVMESMLDTFKSANNWSSFSERFSVYNGTD